MTAVAIPTVEELVEQIKEAGWPTLNQRVDELAAASIEPAMRIRQHAVNTPTMGHIGYYWNPETEKAALFLHDPDNATATDIFCCSRVIDRAGLAKDGPVLTEKEASDGEWIKVAYSPTIRGIGEKLNFFPGYGPLPNQSGPMAGMLTSGLLGAGLGYGAGWLAERFMPEKWKRGRLSRTLGILGGSLGAMPGFLMGAQNWGAGRSFNDPRFYNLPPGNYPSARLSIYERPPFGTKQPGSDLEYLESLLFPKQTQASDMHKEAGDELEVPLGARWKAGASHVAQKAFAKREALVKEAFVSYMPTFGPSRQPLPSINVNRLGQTLWDVGAGPETAAMTMGAVHAANQMPGGSGDSGWVTPLQMARLGSSMGAGYLSGGLVGSVLGALTGLPEGAQDKLKETGMYLGIVKDVVPQLYGR
jgi:hypothetical protein